MPLSKEEQEQYDALTAKAVEKDEPSNAEQRRLNTNITIDLDNEIQVKRAVKAGLLPASYLEDDPPADDDKDGGDAGGDPPRRRSRYD